MSKDYETSHARNLNEFLSEQGLDRDLTVEKRRPANVGAAMSRPHQTDDLDYAINPTGREAQERYLQESERSRLQQAADNGSPMAIAKLSGPKCKICSRYSPFENYEGLSLNSLVEGYVKEYYSQLMPELKENSKLVKHVCYFHEPETKKACEVMQKVWDSRRRWDFIKEHIRLQERAETRYKDYEEAARLEGIIRRWMKVLQEEVNSDSEVKEIISRLNDGERDKTILHICESKIKEGPYAPHVQEGGGAATTQ
jgi:hypothetical protein